MIDKNQVQSRYVDEWNCNIIIVSNLSGTGRFPWEIWAWHCVITSRP